jgi:REP element-mobilizing transposase RayT
MREFPRRLQHRTPGWVKPGALFHVRLRVAPSQAPPLTTPALAAPLLEAAARYHDLGRWWCDLMLLMPDHVHALVAFPGADMGGVIRDWKRGTARFQRVVWQENFFDHRIRSAADADEKWRYIRLNPVVKGLCADIRDWPWWWSGR